MALTIANLPYQEDRGFLHTILRETYSWFDYKSVLVGYKGKATISNFTIGSDLLIPFDCVANTIDTDLAAKEIKLIEYGFSFPVERCDLQATWLNAFAQKYQNASEVYIENLMPYVAQQLSYEVRACLLYTSPSPRDS